MNYHSARSTGMHGGSPPELTTSPPPTGKRDKDILTTPNRPHPALEYPAFYFVLKKWPWLRKSILSFYDLRWRMSYPLQKNMPMSSTLRKLKLHLTYGELLIILPFWIAVFCALAYTFVEPSVSATGHVARTSLIGCFVFAQRNSFITLILGMPVDRTLFYHKFSARVALLGTICHAWAFLVDPKYQNGAENFSANLANAFEGTVNTAGSMMALMMIGIVVTALPVIRRRLFECFYYIHVSLVFGTVCGAFFHTGILVPLLVLCTWGVDIFLRSVVMARTRYPQKAKLRVLSNTVVELSFPKVQGFDYNPGQYVYVALPEISMLQWHPFSLSSSPQMKTVTLHIRKAGNWTSALYELAQKKSEVAFLCEGPYGSLGVNLFNDRYKMVMLFSGGIGITPMQSICDQLLFEQARSQRQLKKLKFIWTDRDPVMMKEAPVVRRSSSLIMPTLPQNIELFPDNDTVADHSFDFFSQLLSLVPPGISNDEELEQFYESLDVLMELDAEALEEYEIEDSQPDTFNEDLPDEQGAVQEAPPRPPFQNIPLGNEDDTTVNNQEPWSSEDSRALGDVLDLQLYLTGNNGNLVPNMPNAVKGRPNIKELFVDMKMEALARGERRVAVCVCAPQKLSALCRKACIVYSDDLVRFDFHTESMEA